MLPADVARCGGVLVYAEKKCTYTAHIHPTCADCLRRTEPPHDRQVYIVAPDIIEGCSYKLVPE